MSANYRIGVIGHTGRGNYGHGLDVVWRAMPNCSIVGVADADRLGLPAAAKRLNAPLAFADYRKMLDQTKPDVVSIAPRWLDQHRDMVLAAAERGIHIYLEKPMCRTLAEADEMVAACEKHNVKLAIAFQTRYSPILDVVKAMIEDGAIGDVLELRGRGKEDRRGGGEDLWVLGSHVMNLIHYFGGEPEWCFASVLAQDEPITESDVQPGAEGIGPLAGDTIHAMYGMPDGAAAYFGSQRNAAGGRFGLQIYGSKGALEILTGYLPKTYYLQDPAWSPGRSGAQWIPVTSAGPGKPETIKNGSHQMGNLAACRDLLSAIEEDRLPEANIYEGRTTVEMIASVFESQRQRRPVTIPLQRRENPLLGLKDRPSE